VRLARARDDDEENLDDDERSMEAPSRGGSEQDLEREKKE
jgi:hypothetical protein